MVPFLRYFLLLIGIGAMGFAGQSPEKAQSASPFKIRVQVDLSMVEVMASDKQGMPVRNLKKEDFRLFEDGKEQEILSIDEVNAESELSPLGANLFDECALHRGKTVLLVFARSIDAQALIIMRESAARFVKEHMRPQDIFAVANYHLPQPIVLNFTSNKEDVLQAINHLAIANTGNIEISLDNLLRAFKEVIPSLSKIRGQKTVLFFAQPISSADHNAQTRTLDKFQNSQNTSHL